MCSGFPSIFAGLQVKTTAATKCCIDLNLESGFSFAVIFKRSILWIYLLFVSLLGSFSTRAHAGEVLGSGLSFKTGDAILLDPSATKKGLVLIFVSPVCPCSLTHETHLSELAQKYTPKGFKFVGVHSNANENFESAKAHFGSFQMPFDIVSDPQSKIADRLQALSTPHAFVIAPSGELLYAGGVSDSSNFFRSRKRYLERVLEEVSEGKVPSLREARVLGCIIQRP